LQISVPKLREQVAGFRTLGFSPDGSGILFLPPLGKERYSGQQEKAPNKKNPSRYKNLTDFNF